MFKINKILFSIPLIASLFFSYDAEADTGYKYYNGHIVKWHKKDMEICLTNEVKNIPGIVEAAKYSSNLWNSISSIPKTYVNLEGSTCDIEIDYTNLPDNWDVPPLAINTLTASDNGALIKAHIDFNKKYDGRIGDPKDKNTYDLTAVFAHELGHALGLEEEPNDQTSIMYERFEPGFAGKRTLKAVDIKSIIVLYNEL